MPIIAFLAALFAISMWMAGLEGIYLLATAATLVVAAIVLLFGDKEYPVSARVTGILAGALALSPLLAPTVQDYRLGMLAAQRARETAPMFRAFDQIVEELRPQIEEFYRVNRTMPDFLGTVPMPGLNGQGQRVPLANPDLITVPNDPFLAVRTPLRIVAIRDAGSLIVSVGQSEVRELVLPGVAMDPAPAHPLAPFAMTGQNPRTAIWTPARGALGLGDVVAFHGRMTLDEAFADLDAAWRLAESRSILRPPPNLRPTERDPDPQSARDGSAAARLLQEEQYLSALALASRGLNLRHPMANRWVGDDLTLHRTRGLALYHLAAYREAADALALQLVETPDDDEVHFFLGAALVRVGRSDAAVVHFAAASQINPAGRFADMAERAFQEVRASRMPSLPEPRGIQQSERAPIP